MGLLGWAGALILLLAWMPALRDTLKSRKSSTPLHFTAIYLIGSLLLTVDAILIRAPYFAVLNAFAALAAAVNLYFALVNRGEGRS